VRLLFIALLIGSRLFSQSVSTEIRDLWTGQPLSAVQAVCAGDTVFSEAHGFVFFPEVKGDSVFFSHPLYYPRAIACKTLNQQITFLQSVETTAIISILAEPSLAQSRNLPAHIGRLEVKEQSLSNTLSRLGSVQIRDYGGSGQTQTIRIRGMSAEQTQVLFDGIPINNLQLGQTDLGLISGGLIGNIEIYRGGGMSFGGSGAIGGTVNLSPQKIEPGWQGAITSALGSLDNRHLTGRAGYGSERWQSMVILNRSTGQNKFSINENGQTVTLQNRDYKNLSAYGELRIRFAPDHSLQVQALHVLRSGGSAGPFHGGYSDSGNVARMKIDNSLLAFKYETRLLGRRFETRYYQRNEWMTYSDDESLLFSRHFNREAGVSATINLTENKNIYSSAALSATGQKAESTDLRQASRSTLQQDLFITVRPPLPAFDWQIFSTIRTLYFPQSGQSAILPGAALQLSAEYWQSYVSLQKNYRLPGFNDLFWQPGGNPGLKPEQSLTVEWGLEGTWSEWIRNWVMETTINIYQNEIRDMIRWQPGAGYWSPANIRGVRARGLEFSARADFRKSFGVQGSYFLNATTKTKSESAADHTVGNFVPQVPRETFVIDGYFEWNNWRLSADYRYTGFQYLTFENDEFLPGFALLNFGLSKEIQIKNGQVQLTGRVRNALSESYATLPGYPMPAQPLFEIIIEIKY